MRVRNTHPNRPLMCSGLHLLPGVWHPVDEEFRLRHGGVADLEFQDDEPATLASEPPTQPTDRPEADEPTTDAVDGQAAPYSTADDLGYAHAAAAEDDEDLKATLERKGYDPDPDPKMEPADPYEQGRTAAQAGQPEDSCPFPDGRTKDAKEWKRGWKEASTAT